MEEIVLMDQILYPAIVMDVAGNVVLVLVMIPPVLLVGRVKLYIKAE
jgi:hypothetical protein